MVRGLSTANRVARKKAGRKAARWAGVDEPKGQRKEAIIRSVATVLRNSQMSSITMDDIANELGITKGNLYYYFKNKQDILFHCHMRSIDISLRALDEAMAAGQTPRERLALMLTGHIRGSLEDGFGGRLQTDLEDMRPDQRKLYVRKRDELEQGVRRLIADGIRDGQFECSNVKLTGFAILGAINWMPKWYRTNGPYTPAQIAAEMVDYFLRGLTPVADQSRRNDGKTRGRHATDAKSGRAFEKTE